MKWLIFALLLSSRQIADADMSEAYGYVIGAPIKNCVKCVVLKRRARNVGDISMVSMLLIPCWLGALVSGLYQYTEVE